MKLTSLNDIIKKYWERYTFLCDKKEKLSPNELKDLKRLRDLLSTAKKIGKTQ